MFSVINNPHLPSSIYFKLVNNKYYFRSSVTMIVEDVALSVYKSTHSDVFFIDFLN